MTVQLDDVSKRFGDVSALDGLSLDVAEGELLALVGPSGSGKSTVLRVIAGLEAPSAGRVRIGGRDVTAVPPHRRDVALVFQDYALYPHLTARDNLAFGMRVRREPAAHVSTRVREVAELLGLAELLGRYPDQLSGGQRQRIALGRAMVREPRVYLLDEPLSNLDVQLRTSAREEIVALHRRLGTTTLHVTHDQAEAMTVGDRVVVLADGRIQQVGAPQQVYDEPVNVFVAGFLGSPPMNLVPGGGVLGGEPGTVVGVRPEDFRPDAAGSVEATVAVVESLGSETVLSARCGDGTRIAVRTGPRSGHRVGEALRLAVDPARRHVFDTASGLRR